MPSEETSQESNAKPGDRTANQEEEENFPKLSTHGRILARKIAHSLVSADRAVRSSQTITVPSFPDEIRVGLVEPAIPSTALREVDAISCPGRVLRHWKVYLSSRWIKFDGVEADAA